jgi:hypothetical protein
LATASPVQAADCAGLTAKLTSASRTADAAMIRKQAGQKVRAGGINAVLTDGQWRLVWASPVNAEQGVFFFRRTGKSGWRYVDVWGGVAAPDEHGDVVKWARALSSGDGAPPRIAQCFADRVIGGE